MSPSIFSSFSYSNSDCTSNAFQDWLLLMIKVWMVYTGIISLQYYFVRMAHLYPQHNSFDCRVLFVWYDLIDNTHIYTVVLFPMTYTTKYWWDCIIIKTVYSIFRSHLKYGQLLWMGKSFKNWPRCIRLKDFLCTYSEPLLSKFWWKMAVSVCFYHCFQEFM